MINKLFKKLIVLGLCIAISIPTNAAVSVSDGSAFVTKVEFNADLDNLNNRMAYLENSLDSKIDNLVSSYLTRNGIWNGEKQQVLNNLGTMCYTSSGQQIFANITKSGLMILPYYIKIDYYVGVCLEYYSGDTSATTGTYVRAMGSPVSYALNIKLNVYNQTSSESYQSDDLFFALCGEFDTGNYMSYAYRLDQTPTGAFTFFVEKGDNMAYTLSTSLSARLDWWALKTDTITGNEKTLSGRCMGAAGASRRAKWIDGSYYKIYFGISGEEISVY